VRTAKLAGATCLSATSGGRAQAPPARVLDLKHLRAIALAFLQVGIAELELHAETLPGGAALVVLELDLAINPVITVRVAAIDLPGFGHDESRVMYRQQFAALIVNHCLPFTLERDLQVASTSDGARRGEF
jgi:hypothetical protein